MLSKHPDACRFPHGHTRKIEFVLEADELDENEMVCDFKVIRETAGRYLETLDHALCVNRADAAFTELRTRFGERVVPFDRDPTTEVLAQSIFEACGRKLDEYAAQAPSRYPLRRSVRLVGVRVWETASSWAEYRPAHKS